MFTLLFAPTVFAQCDPNSAGGFTDTAYDSGADGSSTAGVDNNGGWNEDAPYPYIEAGQKIIGDSFRVKGIVGTYDGSGAGNGDTVRDLDWIHFSVAQDCSLTVTLSMADKNGIALNGTDLFDLLFIQQGSDPSTSIDLYGSYGVDGCPHYALNELPNGDQQSQFPVNAGDILLIVTTRMDLLVRHHLPITDPCPTDWMSQSVLLYQMMTASIPGRARQMIACSMRNL